MTFSDGVPRVPRRITRREKIADNLYLNLQILSRLLFIILGLAGYYFYSWLGLLISIVVGIIIGIWMRRSMGIRGSDGFAGFYIRMHERANGSRPGLLEWVIEKIRGNEFTQAKCQAIYREYEEAMEKLQHCLLPDQKEQVFIDLDKKIKEISYG